MEPALGYSGAHGDEGIDLAPFIERALEDVVEVILNFGVYPQPRHVGLFLTTGSNAPCKFDLYDWMHDNNVVDPSDLREYFILSMNDHSRCGKFEDARSKYEKLLTRKLLEQLKDSDIVRDKALEFAEEDHG